MTIWLYTNTFINKNDIFCLPFRSLIVLDDTLARPARFLPLTGVQPVLVLDSLKQVELIWILPLEDDCYPEDVGPKRFPEIDLICKQWTHFINVCFSSGRSKSYASIHVIISSNITPKEYVSLFIAKPVKLAIHKRYMFFKKGKMYLTLLMNLPSLTPQPTRSLSRDSIDLSFTTTSAIVGRSLGWSCKQRTARLVKSFKHLFEICSINLWLRMSFSLPLLMLSFAQTCRCVMFLSRVGYRALFPVNTSKEQPQTSKHQILLLLFHFESSMDQYSKWPVK